MPDLDFKDPSDADPWIEQYLAGRLSEEDATRLLEALQRHPELGQRLLDQMNMDAMLRDHSQAEKRGQGPATSDLRPAPPPRVRWAIAAAACLAALAAGAGLWIGRSATRADGTAAETTTAAVAVLARAVDAVWAEAPGLRSPGTPLEPGPLRLKSGLVEVEFYRGARVLVEGPSELRLVSSNEAFCTEGRLSAEVPPQARGFRMGTPRGVIVDLGTAYGLDVKGGGAEVHVFKGEVELHPSSAARTGLREGQAATVGTDGTLRLFEARASAFTSPANLDVRAAAARRQRYESWQASEDRGNADPSLLARYLFDLPETGGRSLRNCTRSPSASGDAAVVGCGRAEGRWPGKGALEFRNLSDRVRISLPGESRSLTLAVWVRVDGLERPFNSLLMSDSFNPGAVHWQIRGNGAVHLGVAGPGSPGRVDLVGYDSPVVFTPDRFGRWTHVAMVYDAAARQVTHYADGRPLKRQPLKTETSLRIGHAELGNWNPDTMTSDRTPIRYLNGRMDEFAVYNRALSDAEIERACSDGWPQR